MQVFSEKGLDNFSGFSRVFPYGADTCHARKVGITLPKVTQKRSERNGMNMRIERYSVEVRGAKMVSDLPKQRCKEI